MIGVSDLSRWSIGAPRRSRGNNRVRRRYETQGGFEVLEMRAVMDGSPFGGGGGGGPYQEPGDLASLSAAQILQLVVDMNLTTKTSVGALVQTLDFDEVFRSMTNLELMKQLMRIDLVRDYADIDDLVRALPAAGIDLTTLRPEGLLTAMTTARGGNLLTVSATTAMQNLKNLYAAAPLTFLNIFDVRPLLELFDDRITSAPGAAADPLYVVPFVPVQGGLNNILNVYHLDTDKDAAGNEIEPLISRAITELNAMPAGSRVMISNWIGFYGFGTDEAGITAGFVDPVDYYGNPAEFFTIWSDLWEQQIYQKYDDWFGRLKAAGGQLDAVILDIECKSFSFWSLSQVQSRFATPTGRTVWQAMKEDPRWGAVEAELKAYGLTTAQLNNIGNWVSTGAEAQIWNAVMERRRADYINRGIFDAIRKHFPDVRMSNYGNYYHAQTQPSGLYNRFTHSWSSVGSLVGTTQAQELYVFPRSITTPTTSYDSAPPSQAAIATIQGVNGVVTVTTYRNISGLRPGDTVRIYEQIPRGIDAYVGLYTVHQVINDYKFTFLKPGNLPLVTLPNATATGYAEFFNSWNALVHDMKYVRTQVASSSLGLHPWIAAPGWSQQLRGLPFTYWTEQVLHTALHDVEEIIFWNSPKAGMDPAGQGNAQMNQTMAELQPLIGYADRRNLVTSEADWYDGYLLSGMEVNGVRVWRFTPDPKLTLSITTGANTTFTVGGKQVTIPNSYIYTPPNPVSNKGYWVVQTAGTSELIGTVDQVLALLAEGAGAGSIGEASVLPLALGQWNPNVTWVDVRTGDFDGDGDHDIVGRSLSTGEWWIGRMSGAGMTSEYWGMWSTAVNWTNVEVGDFDGDGRDDLIGRDASSGNWWVARSTGNSFVSQHWGNWSLAFNWQHVTAADVDGDGDADLVGRAAQNGDLWVARSNGTQFTNQLWGNFSTTLSWVDVKVGDFNGDGRADFAGRAASNGAWWVGVSNGSQFVNTPYGMWSTAVTWSNVLLGDFDGDGKADLLGKVLQSGQWWLAKSGSTGFTNLLWGSWPVSIAFEDLMVIDLNSDGRDDVIGRVAGSGIWWRGMSQPTGMTYQYLGNRPNSANYVHKLVLDLDGDGYVDDLIGRVGSTGDWWWDF